MDRDAEQSNPFVQYVAGYVRGFGYEPVIDKPDDNDAFAVDIAIINPSTGLYGLGIECDAPGHRLLKSARHRELWSPSVLSRSLGRMHRISSREWYQKKSREKDLLRQAIEEAFGSRIEPQSEHGFVTGSKPIPQEIVIDNYGEQQSLW